MEHLVVLSFIFSKFLECGILRKRLNSDKNWRNSTKKLEKNEGKRYDRKEEILEEEHVTY
ncbi:TPA: hypothetical protein ACJXFM_002178 [Streptococcus pneumoniae]|uniref:Uncharacterized protein n=7 Tax=Streptococcus pneumoniae TaxID=1313 RepID=Q8CY79_STRR6|nr:hypothetical protein [Streptococcus pneumoniae]EDK63190.1 arginyl-tRNA synthetase [Streptococcus pneumoniae SP11-BS70]EDK65896.1 hypothetical protein CGSSp14BS69_00190 [Streptococcus pneumoniae SP14-BS69]EDK68530.1 arginyl-tRNA synthetase [Streptococcus pneumoniae SP18-BS74]EDK70815.1 hypothetical protein CGSSp19BS75_02683 [Streptococcus pneumoniae SP19-BS75]EDK75758.1 hypothetical protein CGSSp6BS73_12101 [Streptococcus pneumoniae SP6-BS73]EDK80147.1 arginyl-tRNA synthetase [Streptococcus